MLCSSSSCTWCLAMTFICYTHLHVKYCVGFVSYQSINHLPFSKHYGTFFQHRTMIIIKINTLSSVTMIIFIATIIQASQIHSVDLLKIFIVFGNLDTVLNHLLWPKMASQTLTCFSLLWPISILLWPMLVFILPNNAHAITALHHIYTLQIINFKKQITKLYSKLFSSHFRSRKIRIERDTHINWN